MHKQWFFQRALPRLKEGFQNINEEEKLEMDVSNVESLVQRQKANYLTALSHLLRHLQKQVCVFIIISYFSYFWVRCYLF